MNNEKVEREYENPVPTPAGSRTRPRKACRFCIEGVGSIDPKDIKTLQMYVPERGKLLPRRISGVCSKHQRMLAEGIKRSGQVWRGELQSIILPKYLTVAEFAHALGIDPKRVVALLLQRETFPSASQLLENHVAVELGRGLGYKVEFVSEEIGEESQPIVMSPQTVEETEEDKSQSLLSRKMQEVLKDIASAIIRMDNGQQEIEQLRTETRAMLTRLLAA